MTDRKNIKVKEELFERMKADKGHHRSWPQYFEDKLGDGPDGVDTDALVADLVAQLPPKVADELEGRLR